MHCVTFYHSALRHEQHGNVTALSCRPFRVDSSEKGLVVVVMFCSCETMLRRSCLTFTTLAGVLNALCESL